MNIAQLERDVQAKKAEIDALVTKVGAACNAENRVRTTEEAAEIAAPSRLAKLLSNFLLTTQLLKTARDRPV